jgi:hypothetical protein
MLLLLPFLLLLLLDCKHHKLLLLLLPLFLHEGIRQVLKPKKVWVWCFGGSKAQ